MRGARESGVDRKLDQPSFTPPPVPLVPDMDAAASPVNLAPPEPRPEAMAPLTLPRSGESPASLEAAPKSEFRGVRNLVSTIFHTPLSFVHENVIVPRRARIAQTQCKVHGDFERLYEYYTPKVVSDYVRSRSGEDPYRDRNAAAFAGVTFTERAPDREHQVDLSVSLLGGLLKAKRPYGFSPVGSQGASWPKLELLRAQVAQHHGIVDIPSTFASVPLEQLRTDLSGFQLYIPKGMQVGIETVLRAKDAGYKFLTITMDTRECGIRIPAFYNQDAVYIEGSRFQKALKGISMLMPNKWGWLINHLYGGGDINFPNVVVDGRASANENVGKQLNSSAVTWGKIEEIVRAWDGPFVIKGLAHIDDVQQAYDVGADAVILSNHGGRQLSQAAPTLYTALQVVPQVRERGLKIEVWLDGGVYNGNAICAAKAAGVDFVLCGRGPAYAGGFAGEAGLERWVTVIDEQLRNTMLLTNRPVFTGIDETIINRWGDLLFDLERLKQ